MALADLTAASVTLALQEFDGLGSVEFLTKYGFADAKRYWIIWNGKRYPSKAIAGAAHNYIDGRQPLASTKFTGGESSVVKKIRKLGFEIEAYEQNPDWNIDEIILALDLYMTNPASPPSKASDQVLELSRILNKMHRLDGVGGSPTLRNANGIYLKMMNLRSLDPAFTSEGKVGMKRLSALDKIVWKEYRGQRDQLAAEAMSIRQFVNTADEDAVADLPFVEPYEGEEGGVKIVLHKRRERDPRLITKKRNAAMLAGSLACEVCGFDFHDTDGDLGAGFIEVHHLNPLHAIKSGAKTKLSELALLCSNCHRMAHRKRIPLSLKEIKDTMTGTQ